MQSAAILGLLDANMAGPQLETVYAAARTQDAALGANAPDGWKNRRELAARLTSMVDVLTDAVMKSRAGTTPH